MFYDAHTHLNSDQLYPERQTYLERFVEKWGKWIVNVWVDSERNERAIQIAEQAKQTYADSVFVKASIGIHPGEVSFGKIASSQDIQKEIAWLEKLYQQHPEEIVAIWECGIDAHYANYEIHKPLQQELFHAHAQLAKKLELPIIIHSRDHFADTMDVIQHYPELKVYFHCRGYTPEDIQLCAKQLPNLRVWFCGNITYPKAAPLRDSFQHILEYNQHIAGNKQPIHILLETDAPYLSPQSKRWQQNEPINVIDIYAYVSTHYSIPLEQLQSILSTNFTHLYWKISY